MAQTNIERPIAHVARLELVAIATEKRRRVLVIKFRSGQIQPGDAA